MGIFKGILAVAYMLVVSCSYFPHRSMAEKVYDVNDAFRSVVKIGVEVKIVKRGVIKEGMISGTAWAIDRDHLVSAGHVCQAFIDAKKIGIAKDIKISYLDSSFDLKEKVANDVRIVLSDAVNDVCLMEYKGHGLVPLKLAADVKFGEEVYVVGAPVGFLGFVFEGRVAGRSVDVGSTMKNKLIVSAAATGGNSGGPVLNQKGEVVGILIAGLDTFDHFSVCTGLGVLRPIIALIGALKT
jgi:S1-C subfamily serine protease